MGLSFEHVQKRYKENGNFTIQLLGYGNGKRSYKIKHIPTGDKVEITSICIANKFIMSNPESVNEIRDVLFQSIKEPEHKIKANKNDVFWLKTYGRMCETDIDLSIPEVAKLHIIKIEKIFDILYNEAFRLKYECGRKATERFGDIHEPDTSTRFQMKTFTTGQVRCVNRKV